jgi:DNA-directed RNA polymerase subunit RPC12/RpoP
MMYVNEKPNECFTCDSKNIVVETDMPNFKEYRCLECGKLYILADDPNSET